MKLVLAKFWVDPRKNRIGPSKDHSLSDEERLIPIGSLVLE